MGHSKGNTEREVPSNTGLPKKKRKMSYKQSVLTSKRTRGTTTNKAWASTRKEIIKIRAELTDIETKINK